MPSLNGIFTLMLFRIGMNPTHALCTYVPIFIYVSVLQGIHFKMVK